MYRVVFMAVFATLGLQVFATAQSPSPSVWDGIYTIAQADRGQKLYQQYCANCHGQYLEGTAEDPLIALNYPHLAGRGKPPLAGWEFRENWTAMSVGDLYERFRISMPQNAIGSLTGQQNADILAYVVSRNGYPSGAQELAPNKADLDRITFEAW